MNNKSVTKNSEVLNLPALVGGQGALFIDRDGTLIKEVPPLYKVDSFEKLEFYPHVFDFMNKIAIELKYKLVMVSNQDGLGTLHFPEEQFWPVQNFVMKALENEGIHFSDVLLDRTFPEQHAATRKPGIGMFTSYLNNPAYDIPNSFVIGDRITDMQLAKNLGCKGIWLKNNPGLGAAEIKDSLDELKNAIVLETKSWEDIYEFLKTQRKSDQKM